MSKKITIMLFILLTFWLIIGNGPLWAELKPHTPDAPFSEEKKELLKQEIEKYEKLLETECEPVTSALKGLAVTIESYLEAHQSYYDNLEAQQEMIAEATSQFTASKSGVSGNSSKDENSGNDSNSGDDNSSGPTVMDSYLAMIKEAKELGLFTDKSPSYVDPEMSAYHGATWVDELDWAFEEWVKKGKPSPYTRHDVYFFEPPEKLSGNHKASLGELATLHFELKERQKEFHRAWKEERQKAIAQQAEKKAKFEELGQKVTQAMVRTDELVPLIKNQIKRISSLAHSGKYEHCYGYTKEKSGELTDQLPWVVFARQLEALPIPPQLAYPDLTKIPARLPVILLKSDGVEHYLRVKKMFQQQAKVDAERAGHFLLNLYDNTADKLSAAAGNIYETGEFLVKAGVMTVDTLSALGTAGLATLKGSVTGDYNFDPLGSISRTEELLNNLDNVQKAMSSFCSQNKSPVSNAGSAANASYCAMAGIIKVSGKLGSFLESTSYAWLSLSDSEIENAESLGQLGGLRDMASKIEQGTKDYNYLVGNLSTEIAIDLGALKLLIKNPVIAKFGKAKVTEKAGEIRKGLEKTMESANRLDDASKKFDDIRDAIKTGRLSLEDAAVQVKKVTKIIEKDSKVFKGNLDNYPDDVRLGLETSYNQKFKDLLKNVDEFEDLRALENGPVDKGKVLKTDPDWKKKLKAIDDDFDKDLAKRKKELAEKKEKKGLDEKGKDPDEGDLDDDFFADDKPEVKVKVGEDFVDNTEIGKELGKGQYAKAFDNLKNPDEVVKVPAGSDLEKFNAMVDRSTESSKLLEDVGIEHAKITGKGDIISEGKKVPSFTQQKVPEDWQMDKIIKKDGGLTTGQQEAVVKAVRELNKNGIVMGDLKPDNVYLKHLGGDRWEMGVLDLDYIGKTKHAQTATEIAEIQYAQVTGKLNLGGVKMDAETNTIFAMVSDEVGGGSVGVMGKHLSDDFADMILDAKKWDNYQNQKIADLGKQDAGFLKSKSSRGPTKEELSIQKREREFADEKQKLKEFQDKQHKKELLQSMCDRYLNAVARGVSKKVLSTLVENGFHCGYPELKNGTNNPSIGDAGIQNEGAN